MDSLQDINPLMEDTVLISLNARHHRLIEDTVLILLESGPCRLMEETVLRLLEGGPRRLVLLFYVWPWFFIACCC